MMIIGYSRAGGASLSPSEISGLHLWLDSSDSSSLYTDDAKTTNVSSDGDAVAVAADLSGNGYDWKQTTASRRPLYKTSIYNGLSTLRFDGSNDDMAGTSFTAIGLPLTIVGVFKYASISLNLPLTDSSGGPRLHAVYNRSPPNNFGIFAGTEVNSSVATDTSIHYFTTYIGSGAADSLWLDGTQIITNKEAGNPNLAVLHLASNRLAGGSAYMNGDLCELCLYTKTLSTTERENLEAYMVAKWGL